MLGGIIAGIGAIVGSIIGARAGRKSARENRDFQENAAKNQYRWAVDDMRNAGLNPALAYGQGGAGTLSGSQAQDQGQEGQGVAEAAMQYAQLSQIQQNINSAKAQESMTKNQERIATALLPEQIANIRANTQSAKANANWGSPLKVGGQIYEKISTPVKNTAKDVKEYITDKVNSGKQSINKVIPTTKNKNLNRMFNLK